MHPAAAPQDPMSCREVGLVTVLAADVERLMADLDRLCRGGSTPMTVALEDARCALSRATVTIAELLEATATGGGASPLPGPT